jgi:hypothetical protein
MKIEQYQLITADDLIRVCLVQALPERSHEQRDELAPFPLTEMHPIPQAQGTHPRISEAGPAR